MEKFIQEKNLDWMNLSDFSDANENPTKYLFEQKVTDLKVSTLEKPMIYLVHHKYI